MPEPSASADFGCDDAEDDVSLRRRNCGICSSEEGGAVMGRLHCCDHYFCFLCILEWSKIESRCPLCKRRFVGIRRMRNDGSFIGDRAVIAPLRHQILNPDGSMTTRPLHPNMTNVTCSICAGSGDEYLLLVCDPCDTALHTYCAGLGFTVPEGNGLCPECAQVKAEAMNNNRLFGLQLQYLIL